LSQIRFKVISWSKIQFNWELGKISGIFKILKVPKHKNFILVDFWDFFTKQTPWDSDQWDMILKFFCNRQALMRMLSIRLRMVRAYLAYAHTRGGGYKWRRLSWNLSARLFYRHCNIHLIHYNLIILYSSYSLNYLFITVVSTQRSKENKLENNLKSRSNHWTVFCTIE